MLIDDMEPTARPKKPTPLDGLSIEELKIYVTELKAEIARVEAAIGSKEAHRAAVSSLFRQQG